MMHVTTDISFFWGGAIIYFIKFAFDLLIIQSSHGGLGISIAGGTDNPHVDGNSGIFITKLITGTPAEKDGRLQ